ncbi:MAG: hypothetical protein ACP5N2_01780 [Candidatus Nanoarchaeia archaeon]
MNKNSMLLAVITVLFFSLMLSACTPTEKQVRKQLDSANYCKVSSDCVNIGPACPFGCQVYVNKLEEIRAERLLDAYNSKCVYGCLPCEEVECQAGKCQQLC